MASRRCNASSMVGSASATWLHPLDGDARAPVAHADLRRVALMQTAHARGDAATRTFDDRVPATEHTERRQRVEALLRVGQPLAPCRREARHRAVEPAPILVEPLPQRADLRR